MSWRMYNQWEIVTKIRTLCKCHTRKTLYKHLVCSINLASDENMECPHLSITGNWCSCVRSKDQPSCAAGKPHGTGSAGVGTRSGPEIIPPWTAGEPGATWDKACLMKREVFSQLILALLVKHGKSLPKRDLKFILKWGAVKCPNITASSILTTAVWDDVGMKLYDLATTGHEPAMHMFLSWRVIFETLKKQEQCRAVPFAYTTGPLPHSAHLKLVPLIVKSSLSHQPPLCPVKGGKGILSHSC